MSFVYHVSVNGSDKNPGTESSPFRSISKAAYIAEAGDTVIVHEGTYREWVSPRNSGKDDHHRIVYMAAPGEKAVIKGSEIVKGWEKHSGTVWKKTLPNSFFGCSNPYATALYGDWLMYPYDYNVHTGDVYINGKSLYEASSLDGVLSPKVRTEGVSSPWTCHMEPIPDSAFTVYTWFAEVDDENTVIYANFHEFDPNKELVEINVRPAVFYPKETGVSYITVKGFELAQAACQWAPPTADQPGLIGPHWSKGWIIEDNDIHDAKCSGVSLGKEVTTGDNFCLRYMRKAGYQNQIEVVFRALAKGWSKEHIGSHIIRHNVIHDCGQNGIVGHMGCIFSQIYDNEIYNIAEKHEFFGHEIAGIKLHAALDVQIHNNNIHDSTLGIWLDWQAQGVRVSKNLFHSNERDIFIEVSHGPFIVDDNIFASYYNLDNVAQGGAYINNLYCGTLARRSEPNRSTPYHFPHTTQVAGSTVIYSGDDRFFNNIFIGGSPVYNKDLSKSGTYDYDGCPASLEEYIEEAKKQVAGDLDRFLAVKQPVYINHNAYYNGAKAYNREECNIVSKDNPDARIVVEGDKTYLEFTVDSSLADFGSVIIDSSKLETPRVTECSYETPDGKAIIFDTDYSGEKRTEKSVPGPIAGLKPGKNKVLVWEKH